MNRWDPPPPVPPADPDGEAAGGRDAGGTLVALCVGQRCSALRALAGTTDDLEELAAAVRATRGGVLVSAHCLGPCALAAVAAVAHRDAATGRSGRVVWLAGVHEAQRAEALVHWVGAGGPAPTEAPDATLPVPLIEALAGVGPPVRVARHAR